MNFPKLVFGVVIGFCFAIQCENGVVCDSKILTIQNSFETLYKPFTYNLGLSVAEKIQKEEVGIFIDGCLSDVASYLKSDAAGIALGERLLKALEYIIDLQKIADAKIELTMTSNKFILSDAQRQRIRLLVAHDLCDCLQGYWFKVINEDLSISDIKSRLTSKFVMASVKKHLGSVISTDFYSDFPNLWDDYQCVVLSLFEAKNEGQKSDFDKILNRIDEVVNQFEEAKKILFSNLSLSRWYETKSYWLIRVKQIKLLQGRLLAMKLEIEQLLIGNQNPDVFFKFKAFVSDSSFKNVLKNNYQEVLSVLEVFLQKPTLPLAQVERAYDLVAKLKLERQKLDCVGAVKKLYQLWHPDAQKIVLDIAIELLEQVLAVATGKSNGNELVGTIKDVLHSPVAGYLFKKYALPLVARNAQSKPVLNDGMTGQTAASR